MVKPQGEQLKIDETTNVATPTVPNVEVESIDKQGNKWVVYDEVDKYPLVLPDVETIMQETQQEIDSDKIKVEFTLTKRQYDLWVKKGAERWLKKALVGAKLKRKK